MACRIDHYTRSVDEAPAAAARAPKLTPFHARSAAASRRRPRAVRIPSHRRPGRAAHPSSESLSDAAVASVCCTRRFAAPTRWHDQHARRRASEHSVRDPLFPVASRAILRMTQARVCGPSQRKRSVRGDPHAMVCCRACHRLGRFPRRDRLHVARACPDHGPTCARRASLCSVCRSRAALDRMHQNARGAFAVPVPSARYFATFGASHGAAYAGDGVPSRGYGEGSCGPLD